MQHGTFALVYVLDAYATWLVLHDPQTGEMRGWCARVYVCTAETRERYILNEHDDDVRADCCRVTCASIRQK